MLLQYICFTLQAGDSLWFSVILKTKGSVSVLRGENAAALCNKFVVLQRICSHPLFSHQCELCSYVAHGYKKRRCNTSFRCCLVLVSGK